MLPKILETFPSLSAAAFLWQELFGPAEYASFASKWLVPSEGLIESYHCLACGEKHQVVCHSKNDFVSVPTPESHCERRPLDPEDVRIHEFDLPALGHALCRSFGIAANQAELGGGAVQRLGWIGQSQCQYPVYMLLKNPHQAAAVAKNLLLEEEQPFVLFSGASIPTLLPQFKKKKCALFSLERILALTPKGLTTIMTGTELFSSFLRDASGSVYVPAPGVKILGDYERITFPDGYTLILKRAYKRRAVVRFIHQWVQHTGNALFDVEVVREAFNKQYPKLNWQGDRIRDELFKRNKDDFERLFALEDPANGRYRLKI